MKTLFWIVFTVLVIAVLVKYGNKNELEIRQGFESKYSSFSVDSRYLRIEEIDGHEYVIYTYGDAGGVCHHEGCNHPTH